MARRTVFNSDKDARCWLERETARVKNLELECIDVLNDRDNETLALRMRIREIEKENQTLTAKSKKQQKRIDWLEERYIYGVKA